MAEPVYDPGKPGEQMTIVCFVSGSGTNYREIVAENPDHNYIVFTNRPDCGGAAIAKENNHEVVVLSHIPYLREARKKYGAGNVPRNCPERLAYEQDLCRLIEEKIGGMPDLICLAGFDQLNTDWMVDRYYPRILNVHPGDTTKGYINLHWIPSAMAILAGEESVRSTLFFVGKGVDDGPVFVQSVPLNIEETLRKLGGGRAEGLEKILEFAKVNGISDYDVFKEKAGEELMGIMKNICTDLQNELKEVGDWKIYPFGVHELVAKGRVRVDGRDVYIDGEKMPEHGYRMDERS
ncbi:phosphoribosylglycinamide formyltransferase [Chloroflexota bacterium]